MEKIRLHRDNQKDLVFNGEEIASTSSKWISGQDQTRWTEYTLYRTAGGKYVLQRVYITRWQGESGSEEAEIFDDADALGEHIGGEISNTEYALIAEAAKKCPELESLIVEEIE